MKLDLTYINSDNNTVFHQKPPKLEEIIQNMVRAARKHLSTQNPTSIENIIQELWGKSKHFQLKEN